jgi:hypothetical protein
VIVGPSYGSSIGQRTFGKHAVVSIGLGANLDVTEAEPATEMISVAQAAPAEVVATTPTDLRRLPGRFAALSRPPTPQGSLPAFAWGDVAAAQPLSGPLPTGLRFLPDPLAAAPSAHLAARFPPSLGVRSRESNGLTTFRRCTGVGWVGSLRRWDNICAAGVRSLRTCPRAFGPKRFSSLRLFSCDDAYDPSPGLTPATRSWFPTALLLAVAVTARAWAALPKEEATLSRGLLSR